MPTYFFCCSYPLRTGSVIEPGNWGRMLRTYDLRDPNQHWRPLRELIFEVVRSKYFPLLPSRLTALFACETEADLQKFMNDRRSDIGYEIELLDPAQSIHRGCLDKVAFPNNSPVPVLQEYFENQAKSYWSGTGISSPEIVTLSSARIIRRI